MSMNIVIDDSMKIEISGKREDVVTMVLGMDQAQLDNMIETAADNGITLTRKMGNPEIDVPLVCDIEKR